MKGGKILLCCALFALLLNNITINRAMAASPETISLANMVFFGIPSIKELKQNSKKISKQQTSVFKTI